MNGGREREGKSYRNQKKEKSLLKKKRKKAALVARKE